MDMVYAFWKKNLTKPARIQVNVSFLVYLNFLIFVEQNKKAILKHFPSRI